MKIELKEIPIRELVVGYVDNDEEGVVGFGGKLDIRPQYQREFIYNPKQEEAVINTITKDFPLNVMYWAVRDDGNFEIIDGQQRTLSICHYVAGDFAYQMRYFHNLTDEEKNQILNYKVMVYQCSGSDAERLAWFETINIAGEELTKQETLNAVYAGSWLSDAKRYFSKTSGPAYNLGGDYLSGRANRQEFLEATIRWISKGNIKQYMATHQHDPNANELWLYFQSVINWVQATFPKLRKEMKGVPWGFLYNDFGSKRLDPKQLESEVARLMLDEDVTSKKGIYQYVFDKDERHLNIRDFSPNQKREAYERQQGVCPICKERFELDEMEADHITPWNEGGKTIPENCQMLCKEDNRRKAGK